MLRTVKNMSGYNIGASETMAPEVIWKRGGGKDIVLNVNLEDALIRFGITLILPIVVLIINVHLVIYIHDSHCPQFGCGYHAIGQYGRIDRADHGYRPG